MIPTEICSENLRDGSAVLFLSFASLPSDCVTILKMVLILIKSHYFQEEMCVFLKIIFQNGGVL